jgi:AcrR family transcriptional regulator
MPAQVAAPCTSQRLLDVALELFSRHGFAGTSVQAIADRVGMTKAAIYYHFRSKDDLLAALVAPAFAELEQLLEAAAAGSGPAARREQAVQGYIEYLLRHRKLAGFLSQDVAVLSRPVVWVPMKALTAQLDQLLTTGGGDATARLWSEAITHALSGAICSQPRAPREWLREQLTAMSTCLLAGYGAARR